MKQRGIYFGLAMAAVFISSAAPITPDEALSRVSESGALKMISKGEANPKLMMTMNAPDGEAALYVFSGYNQEGYMILSADDQIVPLLGYSDSGVFNKDNMAPGLKYWLNEYGRQIEYARLQNVGSEGTPDIKLSLPASWKSIAPLVKTQWNQDAPYNDLCPEDKNGKTYTGCVATSMAQVMNYYEYPATGFGKISYNCQSLGKKMSMNFTDYTFDWDNMLDNYISGQYTEEEGTAVATLMLCAGYAVQMEYSSYESGAVSGRIPGAMVEYFGYDKGIRYLDRSTHTYEEWATLLYNNLKEGMPVILDGSSPDNGGHSFVCDGYNGSGYFHINWGWGGSSDGYYLLDALTPSSIGIGGATGGFNFDQDGVFNIQPEVPGSTATAQSTIYQYGTLTGTVSGGGILTLNTKDAVYSGYGYQGNGAEVFSFGCGYVKADTPDATPEYVTSNNLGNIEMIPAAYLPFSNASYRPKYTLAFLELEEGVTYKLFSAAKPRNGDWFTIESAIGSYNYIYLKKTGGNYEVTSFETMQFDCEGITLDSKLYEGSSVKVTTTLKNNNDVELSRGVGLVLLDANSNVVFYGDSFLLTLEPGQSSQQTWATALKSAKSGYSIKGDTEFYLGLQDLETTVLYYKSDSPVVMSPNPGAPKYKATIDIPAAEEAKDTNGTYYKVENGNDFDVTTEITITGGYFSYDLILHVLQPMATNPNYLESIMRIPYGISFIEEGETASMTVNVNYPGELNKNYYLQTTYSSSGSATWMQDQIRFKIMDLLGAPDTGVDEINVNASDILFIRDSFSGHISVIGGEGGISDVSVYQLNGSKAPVKISSYNGQIDVDMTSLLKGIVIVKATDASGNVKSIKVAL